MYERRKEYGEVLASVRERQKKKKKKKKKKNLDGHVYIGRTGDSLTLRTKLHNCTGPREMEMCHGPSNPVSREQQLLT